MYETTIPIHKDNFLKIKKNNTMIVYEALYNPMTHESEYGTLSIHLSKEGAQKAIELHKMEKVRQWQNMYPEKEEEPYEFGVFEDWLINEVKVLP